MHFEWERATRGNAEIQRNKKNREEKRRKEEEISTKKRESGWSDEVTSR
jgi:hypothetical protein